MATVPPTENKTPCNIRIGKSHMISGTNAYKTTINPVSDMAAMMMSIRCINPMLHNFFYPSFVSNHYTSFVYLKAHAASESCSLSYLPFHENEYNKRNYLRAYGKNLDMDDFKIIDKKPKNDAADHQRQAEGCVKYAITCASFAQ